MKDLIEQALDYLNHGIWRIKIRDLPLRKYFLLRSLRIIVLSFRGFVEDKCTLRASALTFFSLLSVVPVVAMAFGIAKGFGFENSLENLIVARMEGQEEVARWILQFADALLQNTKGGLVAGVGVLILFWAVIKLLDNIEKAFNDIWYLKRGRSYVRKVSDYLAIMLICPLLLIVSSSLNVFITSQMEHIAVRIALLGRLSFVIAFFLKLSPYFFLWILFTFVYMVMPNTGVSFRAALFAGVVAGTVFQVVQKVYIFFQVGVAQYNAIYGSLAALPLFLAWLQVSWLVVLLGCEISFSYDNEEHYEFDPGSLAVSHYFKRLLALRITRLCIEKFCKGEGPVDTPTIAQSLEAPIRLVRGALAELVQARVLSLVKYNAAAKDYFQPAQDVDNLTVKKVLDMLDRHGNENIPLRKDSEVKKLSSSLEAMDRLVRNSSEDILLKNL